MILFCRQVQNDCFLKMKYKLVFSRTIQPKTKILKMTLSATYDIPKLKITFFRRFFHVFSADFVKLNAIFFRILRKKTWKNITKKKFQNNAAGGIRTSLPPNHCPLPYPLLHGAAVSLPPKFKVNKTHL